MSASDELRRRADDADRDATYLANVPSTCQRWRASAAELRALADLVADQISPNGYCLSCGLHVERQRHKADCKLAAVERAFKEQGNE